ncbi:MAG: glycosyltransferase, partial [Pseudonocardiales bacterium]|nr:glycosyltransferase [Pseudonocardiales bacterium]
DSIFLVIAGQEIPHTKEVKDLARSRLPNRHLFVSPKRPLMPFLFNAVDLVALCRLHEGLPVAYLEAMAAGKPLIVHDWELSRWVTTHLRVRAG